MHIRAINGWSVQSNYYVTPANFLESLIVLTMPLKVTHYAKLPLNSHRKVQLLFPSYQEGHGNHSIDFYGPIPDGQHILVAKDQYSWLSACEFVKSASAYNTIPKLENRFADYGNPKLLPGIMDHHYQGRISPSPYYVTTSTVQHYWIFYEKNY